MKKSSTKQNIVAIHPKSNKKYVPTPQQANIIISYFLHNNFQDFNTWQQISKSKCEFQFNEIKNESFECKATLKWDDLSMPVIVQIGNSKNKKNAKKKALHKLVENLIYLGLISFGFKDSDFIKKLPKRRKQSSDQESQNSRNQFDKVMNELISNNQIQEALSLVSYKNFQRLLCMAIKNRNFQLFVKILRKLQRNQIDQQFNLSVKMQDLEEDKWQNYSEKQLQPFEEDLADILRYYQLQPSPLTLIQAQKNNQEDPVHMQLPCYKLTSQGKISLQLFQPIEYTLIFHRNLAKKIVQPPKTQRSDFFSYFYKEIQLPKFEEGQFFQPLPYKVIQTIFNLIIQFSFDYNLVVTLLSIFQRQITTCDIGLYDAQQNQKFYLKQMASILSQFAYVLYKKTKMLSVSIEGLVNMQNDQTLTFVPKQPEQILAQKISKKINTSQMEEMAEFSNEQCVILVSKIDSKIIYIAQIVQCWPAIKIRCVSLQMENQKQKLPFTMYKLSNSKLYRCFSKSISHIAKLNFDHIRQNTFIIQQKPTQPLLSIICELLAEWTILNQTVLIVSDNFNELSVLLTAKGFKNVKINLKTDEKNVSKRQIICCSPSGVCADVIKNYAFTRVIIQGAQRVSQALSALALDKGCKKLYLIGDRKLPSGNLLSKFSKNRNANQSLFTNLLHKRVSTFEFNQSNQQHLFDSSILEVLNKYIYQSKLNKFCSFESPSIKGFPWPSETIRIAFVHFEKKNQNYRILNQQAQFCYRIIQNVVKSGFLSANQIGCRVISTNAFAVLSSNLFSNFLKNTQIGIRPENADKLIDFATGSRFKQKSLCILVGESKPLNLKYLSAAMQQGRRGVIVLGDFKQINIDEQWTQILRWASSRRLIVWRKIQ